MASAIMNEPITVFDALPEKERPRKLVQSFQDKYGSKPAYIARAPGRVSIIGGVHLDQSFLEVCLTFSQSTSTMRD